MVYGNGRDGIRAVARWSFTIASGTIFNNLIVNNGGYGLNQPTAQTHADFPWIDYNAFFNNTSGARNNINASPHDVTLTGDPFTNAAGNDFSLNNVAGAGAAGLTGGRSPKRKGAAFRPPPGIPGPGRKGFRPCSPGESGCSSRART